MIAISDIIRATAQEWQVTEAGIRSPRKQAAEVEARHAVCWLAKKLTDRSLPEIGRLIGGRDHTTVHYAIQRVERLRRDNDALRARLDALASRIVEISADTGGRYSSAINSLLVAADVEAAVELAERLLRSPPHRRSASGDDIGMLARALIRSAKSAADLKRRVAELSGTCAPEKARRLAQIAEAAAAVAGAEFTTGEREARRRLMQAVDDLVEHSNRKELLDV